MNSQNIVFMRRLHFSSRCGQYWKLLTARQLMDILGVSRATAYRMIQDGRLSPVQRDLLELRCFGLIPGWEGWRIEPGQLIDPTGYRYSIGDIQSIPLMRSMIGYGRPINDGADK